MYFALGDRLPAVIESAVVLLRFEKIGRWESSAWAWDNPPVYDGDAKRVAEGHADRRKQDALYVRIGGDGRVCRPQPITRDLINIEKERLSNFRFLVDSLVDGTGSSYRLDKARSFIRAVFSEPV